MSDPLDRLHPAVVYHVVNTLRWPSLRPLQAAAIDPVLDGADALLTAPTAGGKTEAAVLPIFSRMLTEDWRGLSVLYVCPIKALLNNLQERLGFYAEMFGRRSALWHGDVPAGDRHGLVNDPPDVLLTTPESIELMLTSRTVDQRSFFANLRSVVVDEVHAFAGDDRGWHLLALLSRLDRLSVAPIQRIGLSATLGNPDEILDWLHSGRDRTSVLVDPSSTAAVAAPELTLDYVGSLSNAAKAIGALHQGEKRLVFVDSRAAAEATGAALRDLGTRTFVSHSSLSVDARHQAETAFADGTNCVIVATSTLELGLDVGDLDRVLQIDTPHGRVASALQRMGRTGRRSGSVRNYTMLATSRARLLESAALLLLMREGYVEPVAPPAEPWHVAAQQVLALIRQQGGLGRHLWREWLSSFAPAHDESMIESIVDYMVETELVADDGGILGIGVEGERRYGYRYFSELLSVFTSVPLITLLHGRREIGQVGPESFQLRQGTGAVIVQLAARNWAVGDIDWSRRVAYVEPVEVTGRSRWRGSGVALSFALCQAMRRVLVGEEPEAELTERAVRGLADERERVPACDGESLVLSSSGDRTVLWTFGGLRANATLATMLSSVQQERSSYDNLTITLDASADARAVSEALRSSDIKQAAAETPVDDRALEALKFSECVPPGVGHQLLRDRLTDLEAVEALVQRPIRVASE